MDTRMRMALILLAAINGMTVGKNIIYLGWYELVFWAMAAISTFFCRQSAVCTSRRVREGMLVYTLLLSGAYLVLWWVSGYADGFGYSPYSRSALGFAKNLGLFGGIIAAQEYTRAYILRCESSGKQWLTIIAACSFFVYSLNVKKLPAVFLDWGDLFQYIGGTVLPGVCMTVFLTWLSRTAGFLPALIFRLLPEAAQWLLPTLPKNSWQTTMMLGAAFTMFAMIIMQQLVHVNHHRKNAKKERRQKRANPIAGAGLLISVTLMFSFSLGLLPVRPMVIATGSMLPAIRPGDMVILKDTDARSLQVGDVIAYQTEGFQIVHRVMTILPSRQGNSYIMKGDNNDSPDVNAVQESQILGKVIQIIPYIGLLSLSVRKVESPQSVPVETGI